MAGFSSSLTVSLHQLLLTVDNSWPQTPGLLSCWPSARSPSSEFFQHALRIKTGLLSKIETSTSQKDQVDLSGPTGPLDLAQDWLKPNPGNI